VSPVRYFVVGVFVVALACGGDSPTEPDPKPFDAAMRVTGVVLWRDCSPAAGVTVKLREHRTYKVCLNEPFGCTRYSTWVHDHDVTNAEGRYEVDAVVTCPADVRIQAFPDGGSMHVADADPLFCRQGDQTVNIVIGSRDPTLCFGP